MNKIKKIYTNFTSSFHRSKAKFLTVVFCVLQSMHRPTFKILICTVKYVQCTLYIMYILWNDAMSTYFCVHAVTMLKSSVYFCSIIFYNSVFCVNSCPNVCCLTKMSYSCQKKLRICIGRFSYDFSISFLRRNGVLARFQIKCPFNLKDRCLIVHYRVDKIIFYKWAIATFICDFTHSKLR